MYSVLTVFATKWQWAVKAKKTKKKTRPQRLLEKAQFRIKWKNWKYASECWGRMWKCQWHTHKKNTNLVARSLLTCHTECLAAEVYLKSSQWFSASTLKDWFLDFGEYQRVFAVLAAVVNPFTLMDGGGSFVNTEWSLEWVDSHDPVLRSIIHKPGRSLFVSWLVQVMEVIWGLICMKFQMASTLTCPLNGSINSKETTVLEFWQQEH